MLQVVLAALRWTIILVLLGFAGVTALLTTEQGTRWLVAQAERHAPFELGVDAVDGTLFRGLVLGGFRLQVDDTRVFAEQAGIRVDARSLLQFTLRVSELHLSGVTVDLPRAEEPQERPRPVLHLPESVRIPGRLVVEQLTLSNLAIWQDGSDVFQLDSLALALDAGSDTLRVTALELVLAEMEVWLDAELQLTDAYPLQIDARWRFALPAPVAEGFATDHAEGTLRILGDLREQLQLRHELVAGIQVHTEVDLEDPLGMQRFVAHNRWGPFRYRAGAERTLDVASGELVLQGTLDDWRGRIATAASLPDWPDVTLAATVHGSLAHAEIEDLRLRGPAGSLDARGHIDFAEGLAWQLDIAGQDLDPGAVTPALAGQLTLKLETRGALPPGEDLQVDIDLTELVGTLRGQEVDGTAAIELTGRRLRIDRLELGIGTNRLSAHGRIDDVLDLEATLVAPELDLIHPALAGRLQLDTKLDGALESPRISATGQGSGLRYDRLALEQLNLVLDAGLDLEAPVEAALQLSGLDLDGKRIQEVRLGATGVSSAHQLSLDLDSEDLGTLRLRATGRYDMEQQLWEGLLDRLSIVEPTVGSWSLVRPTPLSAGPTRASLDDLCLAREAARLCLSGNWDVATGAEARGSLDGLDLAWLAPRLPPETAIEGLLSATFQASRDASGNLRATLDVPPTDGVIHTRQGDSTEQSFPYRDLRLGLRFEDHVVEGEFGMSFLDDGSAQASVRLRPEADSYRIDGDVRAELQTLAWVGALSPAIENVRGRLRADLELGGLLSAPLVQGSLRLDEGGLLIPEAGIDLDLPLLLADVVSADEVRFTGEIGSGGESLSVEGELGFSAERGPRAEIRIEGSDFLAVNRPDIRARFSPDLTVLFSREQVNVRGEILIPSAMILPPDLPPGAVTVSSDEIVIGEDRVGDAPGVPVDLRVRVLLGEGVRFEGYGLTARLTGDIDVVSISGRPPQITGEVSIVEGNYRAYGQNLTVERGLILFQGPPDTPALDIRAVRQIPEHRVVVGLEVGGTPQELQSRLFSEPPMDDTEVLAFLVTGRPLSGASQSDGNLLAGAAATWGLRQGNLITQRLSSELGLDLFEFETEAGLEQSALTIGKYLSPGLLLRYSVGLFDDSSRVMLRFELSPSLSIETTSSALTQAIDLIYRIER